MLCIGAETQKILEFFKHKVIITNFCSEKLYAWIQGNTSDGLIPSVIYERYVTASIPDS